MKTYILDENNNPQEIDFEDLIKRGKDFVEKIAIDEYRDCKISTIFLGIDHSYDADKPVLFETMVFGGKFDKYCVRYHTYAEATKGHINTFKLVKRKYYHGP